MNYKGKKLLILAGAGIHCKVVEAAKEMGIYTIVTDYLEDSPAKQIADESLMYDIFDVEGLTEWGRKNEIDGVIGFCCDPTSKPAQEIAENLGLPMFGNQKQVLALTKKALFKKMCIENQVDVIQEYKENDIQNETIKFPVLVKPTDSRGSRGITVCQNLKELMQAIPLAKRESSDGKVIIEKDMAGHQDLTISYIVKDGIPTLISVGDRYSGRVEDHLNHQLACTIQPSQYAKMYMEHVNERVVKMIQNLGIENGPVFMQGFVDGNTVRMYDPGIRYPGNEYERIYTKATGINVVKNLIAYCVGGQLIDDISTFRGSYDLNGMCAMQYMINVGPGKIAKFEGLDEIAKHENVVDVQQKLFVGEIIRQTGDIRHRAGEISILVERDINKMKQIIDFIQNKLKIISDNGKNMIISPFDREIVTDKYWDNN